MAGGGGSSSNGASAAGGVAGVSAAGWAGWGAWAGAALARTPPSKRFTYGLKGSTILAALANAVLLLVALGAIAIEAAQRFAVDRAQGRKRKRDAAALDAG